MDYAHKLTDKQLKELEQRISAAYDDAAKELTGTVNSYFEAFKDRDEAMKKRLDDGEITPEYYQQWRLNQIGRGQRYEAMRDKVAERYTNANEVTVSYVNDATPGIYSLNRNYAAYTIEQAGADVDFTLFDEPTVRRLLVENPGLMPSYPAERAVKRGIDLDYGKQQITASVTSGILQGKSIGRIADDMQLRMVNMNRTSALRTARTAITGAQNAGRMDTYRAAQGMGIELEREWVATLDGRTRHEHAMLDGQTAPIDKPFKVDGAEIMYPGDPSAPGYLIYNCRCTLIAALPELKNAKAERWSRDPVTGEQENVSNITYQEWIKTKQVETVLSPSNISHGGKAVEVIAPAIKQTKIQPKPIEKSGVLEYYDGIAEYVDIDAAAIYEAAKSGGRHSGVYKDAMRKNRNQLEKSIASRTKQVREHADKIKNPEEHDAGWADKEQRAKDGLIKKWRKDMTRNAEQATIEIEVWKERFGNNDK